MGPRILTYKGNVEHLMGEIFEAPRLMRNGGIRLVRWVVTNVTFYAEWNKTFVELDVSMPQPPVELA